MKPKDLVEVRRMERNELKPWVVDIVHEGSGRNGYVHPDGTAGDLYKYDDKLVALSVASLYCTKHAEEMEKITTSAGKETNPVVMKKRGHPGFYVLLEKMAELHSRKNHDYSGTSDPLKNLRSCTRLNIEPFMGVLVRLQDKWSRLEEFAKSKELLVKNESVIDTLMDNAVYSLLAILLYQEWREKQIATEE